MSAGGMLAEAGRVRRGDLRLPVIAGGAWLVAIVATGLGADGAVVLAGVLAVGAAAALAAAVVAAVLASRRERAADVAAGSLGTARRTSLPARRFVGGLASAALVLAAVTLGAGALAATTASLAERHRLPPQLAVIADSESTARWTLETSGAVSEGRVAVQVRSVEQRDARIHLDTTAVLFARDLDAVPRGTPLAVTARATSTEPGDDAAVLLFARGSPEVLGAPAGGDELLDGLRAGFRESAARMPGDGGRLLPGLAIGDTAELDPGLDEAMKVASLTHLTAVSGANCAVVVALVFGLLGLLGASRLLRVIGSGIALLGFVALVTPEPSVVRAAVMAGIVLLSLALGRPVRGLPVLGAAVLLLVVAQPALARSYGFVLSVLATAGLLVLAPPLARRLARWMPRSLALAVAVPLAAQLLCQPVLILLQPELPLYGVPANLLTEPAAPIATVLGLIACLVLPFAPPLGDLLCALAWVPSAWIAAIARFAASLPAASLPWLPGTIGAIAVAVAIVVVLVAVLGRGRLRSAAAGLAVLALVLATAGVGGAALAARAGRPADWSVALCDVGQGDATVLRSAGSVALVDTGPDPELLDHCLADLGVDRLQLLVLTHYDLDHVGGADAVIGRVDRVLVGPSDGADADRLDARLRDAGAEVDQVERGERGGLGDLAWEVLWPPERGVEPGNGASVTLSVRPVDGAAGLSALLLGDLGEVAQARMSGVAHPGRYDVVKVAHHGSADQDPDVYARIRARVGLIGVGENDYGHPTSELLGTLADAGTLPLRSDQTGLVLLAGSGDHLRVWTQRAPPDD
ncbi:ComEC/Rec2 family competence protein [Schumannella sp. 10F1B-5-1]|uniref:ComEC/Rec2 family competence protein n=1 Tax=Schumannella sp. 10F1B-5-1 TaxID=2590780 RepID=UPI001130F516|nr:ComEC/Rec2 family competence protein [Schumannella sp. 10F1B-5-1]TPW70203.1 MBL fold metallo-hydrolase [Schumannella sp. 10F1B-5-1]